MLNTYKPKLKYFIRKDDFNIKMLNKHFYYKNQALFNYFTLLF